MNENESLNEIKQARKLYTTYDLYEMAFEKELKLIRGEMQFSPDGTGAPTHPKFPPKHETINSVLLGNEPIDKNIINLIEYLAINKISTHASCEGSRKEGHNSLAYIVFVNYSHLTIALELLRNLAEGKQKDVLAWRIAGYYSVPDGRVDAESMLNGEGWQIGVSAPPLTTADPEGRSERKAVLRFPKADLLELNTILPQRNIN